MNEQNEKSETWCDRDEHNLFEYFVDFNEWLDNSDEEDAKSIRTNNNINGLSKPSKAFFAGDKEAYEEVFKLYRRKRRHEILNERYIFDQFNGDHWFDRNTAHFDQLANCLEEGEVVPFIGAGLSVAGGFPTWKDHLYQQGRTAGMHEKKLEELLSNGQHEEVIEEIENSRGRDVFTQEIRDVFSKTGTITDAILLITELFTDTVLTTNYDRLLEQAYDTGTKNSFQIISGLNPMEERDPERVSIIKLHGDITDPTQCILSKNQYDAAYGNNCVDMSLLIPKLLEYHYKTSSLLILGCSLNDDRTVHVFQAIKEKIGEISPPQHFSIEQAPETEDELRDRNAFLAGLGITGIWFEKEQFYYIEDMLRLARNELRYRGVLPRAVT